MASLNNDVRIEMRQDEKIDGTMELDFGAYDPTTVGSTLILQGRRQAGDNNVILQLKSTEGQIILSAGSAPSRYNVRIVAPEFMARNTPSGEHVWGMRLDYGAISVIVVTGPLIVEPLIVTRA